MASPKTVITITHAKEAYQTIVDKFLRPVSNPRGQAVALRGLFNALAGSDRDAQVVTQVNSGEEVYASGTLTVASGAVADTAVVKGVTFTCADKDEKTDITFAADSGGSLNSKYFTFQDQSGAYLYYLWFSINNAGVDPKPAGRIGIKISGATGATAATLATAAVTACAGTTSAKVTLNADSSGNLNSTYFSFWDQAGANRYYVWFNINNAGVDPKPSGQGIGIKVSGATNATAATLATAVAAACAGISGFSVVNPSSGVVNIFGNGSLAAYVRDGITVATSTQFVFVESLTNLAVTAGASGHIIIKNAVPGVATATLDGPATSTGFTFTRSTTGSALTSIQYQLGTTDTLTAASLASQINANSSLKQICSATSALGVVTVSSWYPGPIGNLITTTATANVTAGGATLANGAVSTTVSAANTYHLGV